MVGELAVAVLLVQIIVLWGNLTRFWRERTNYTIPKWTAEKYYETFSFVSNYLWRR